MKQFKPILCMLLFIGCINPTIAQNNLDDQVKYMLDDLDKSSITSDILLEGGFKLADLKEHIMVTRYFILAPQKNQLFKLIS